MKKIVSAILILAFSNAAFSQAVDGKIDYAKSSQPASIIELPYSPDLVSAALKDFLKKKGVKESSSKGFSQYRGVQLAAADPTPSDLYVKIEKKSRKEDNTSIVSVISTKPGENPATRSGEDTYGSVQAKNFLNEITPAIEAYKVEQNIKGQGDVVKKAAKKLDNNADDGKDLEKQKKRIEEKIAENAKKQEDQRAELEKQKQILDTLGAQKKAVMIS